MGFGVSDPLSPHFLYLPGPRFHRRLDLWTYLFGLPEPPAWFPLFPKPEVSEVPSLSLSLGRLLFAFRATCMRQAGAPREAEASLVVRLGNLEVTIVGPVCEASALLQHLQDFVPSAAPAVQEAEPGARPLAFPSRASELLVGAEPESPQPVLPDRSEPESPHLHFAPRPLNRPQDKPPHSATASVPQGVSRAEVRASSSSGPAVQDPLLASAPPGSSRSVTEAGFPECPAYFLSRARSLGACSTGPPESRILRAWRAGCWAREVLQGNFPTPSASARLDIPSRVYPVLGGPGVQPAFYRAYRDVARALGPLSSSGAVFHGFPSETEAEVYVVAAGLQWPL